MHIETETRNLIFIIFPGRCFNIKIRWCYLIGIYMNHWRKTINFLICNVFFATCDQSVCANCIRCVVFGISYTTKPTTGISYHKYHGVPNHRSPILKTFFMRTANNVIFGVTDPLWGEFTNYIQTHFGIMMQNILVQGRTLSCIGYLHSLVTVCS